MLGLQIRVTGQILLSIEIGKFWREEGFRGKISAVLDTLSLRYLWDIQFEKYNKKLLIQG